MILRAALLCSLAQPVLADPARAAITAFATHCFSPFLTAETAQHHLAGTGTRVEFYDLAPFSNAAPSPGTDVTPGTDRRCAVSFAGNHTEAARTAILDALAAERIVDKAQPPAGYPTPETATLFAARCLNPDRMAIVAVTYAPDTGTRMVVERLAPMPCPAP